MDALLQEFNDCARYGDLPELISLQRAYPDINFLSPTSTTPPLFHAAANNHAHVVRFIVSQSNTTINALNDQKNTPLHWAALNGHIDTVQILLENGADGRLINSFGKSASTLAEEHGHMDVVNLILKSYEPESDEQVEQCLESLSAGDQEER